MCGIFGILNLENGVPLDEGRFARALGTLRHRGPDAQLHQRLSEDVLLGHTRLSIIDLSDSSNQPLCIQDRYWVVYNGEIFNYIELREELEALGAVFKTSGDVEVLLYAYAYWGEACVVRFNGMWGFAIYDLQEKTLFCSRDRFGEKPFNYAIFDGRFFFASEIKAILSYEPRLTNPNYNVISNFCRTSVGAQHSETWFQDVLRLPPGCNLVVRDGKVSITRYWNYPQDTDKAISFDDAKAQYAGLFRDAVKVRMRSDVPLGLTLSAGVDSNSIAYAMQAEDPSPHFCFTSRFAADEGLVQSESIYAGGALEIDESVSARRVAAELGLTSEVVETDYSNFIPSLSRIVYHLESGNSSPAVIPLMQLLAHARTRLTVLLDGQGADELLAGYVATLLWQSYFDLLKAGKLREAFGGMRQYVKTYTLKYSIMMALRNASNKIPVLAVIHQRFTGIDKAFGPALSTYKRMADWPASAEHGGGGAVSRQLRRQHAGGLVNLLHYGDAISMANSLESRMPFLDHRLVEFVWRLPSDFKIKLGIGKHIHRRAMEGLVPDWIINNPIKFGFNTPISNQFSSKNQGRGSTLAILLSDRCISRGMFDRGGLEILIRDHQAGKRDHGPLLFRMLSTELWFRTFVDGDAPGGDCLEGAVEEHVVSKKAFQIEGAGLSS